MAAPGNDPAEAELVHGDRFAAVHFSQGGYAVEFALDGVTFLADRLVAAHISPAGFPVLRREETRLALENQGNVSGELGARGAPRQSGDGDNDGNAGAAMKAKKPPADDPSVAKGLPEGVGVGDPEHLVQTIKRWESIGVTGINFLLNAMEMIPQEQVLASMRLFAEEVMPQFRSKQERQQAVFTPAAVGAS